MGGSEGVRESEGEREREGRKILKAEIRGGIFNREARQGARRRKKLLGSDFLTTNPL
jgi:hypothetical protein